MNNELIKISQKKFADKSDTELADNTKKPVCVQCNGKGNYMYDHNHGTICGLCCKHGEGFWKLSEHYGRNKGKWCCRIGCGKIKETEDE